MSRQTVVVVLHDGEMPSESSMAPVVERAREVRYATAAELPEAIAGADVLFAYDFFSSAIPDAWPAADALEWIHVASTGVDAILSPELRASDVVLTNSRGVFDEVIAEYVLGQVLSFAKDLPRSWELQQARRERQYNPADVDAVLADLDKLILARDRNALAAPSTLWEPKE